MAKRGAERHDISIVGKLRTGTGKRDVTVVDLSDQGCRIFDRVGYLPRNTSVTIKIGPIGPIEATVRWQDQPYAGLRFHVPFILPCWTISARISTCANLAGAISIGPDRLPSADWTTNRKVSSAPAGSDRASGTQRPPRSLHLHTPGNARETR